MSKTIVKAAIKVKDEIFTGFDHGECFKFARDKFPIPVEDLEQGFIDSDGNFVDRKQAMIIAKEAGQLRYEPSKQTLISEDLHIDWLNKQKQIINDLQQEQIAEMKEHQEAMQVADKKIKELEEQLRLSKMSERFEQEKKNITFAKYSEVVKVSEDLEAKLAEKENIISNLNYKVSKEAQNALDNFKRIIELEKQLADTEAQNKRVLEKLDLIVRSNQELEKENELMAKTLRMTKCIEKEINQDKIEFCVAELEKVRTQFRTKYSWYEETHRVCEKTDDFVIWLDQQIKELKEKNV